MREIVRGDKITEGKTKIICAILDIDDEVLIGNKDSITAGNGKKRDIIEGKGILSTETTCNCFHLLNRKGVPTHFIERVDERTFRARRVRMIPIELVARRIATGSYLKRNPETKEGTSFPVPVVEFSLKRDDLHDPLMLWNHVIGCFELHDAKKPIGKGYLRNLPKGEVALVPGDLSEIERLSKLLIRVFEILEEAWARQDVVLVDLKIEGGLDIKTGELLVADVIDNDSWRLWPGGDKARMVDKQVYRDQERSTPEALEIVREKYVWVAEATAKFLA